MKREEFMNVLKEATKPEQKQEAFSILSQIDATKIDVYQQLTK
jgi:hypothetical protein